MASMDLAHYDSIKKWKPQIGDFIVHHGWFTHYFGVISSVIREENKVETECAPKSKCQFAQITDMSRSTRGSNFYEDHKPRCGMTHLLWKKLHSGPSFGEGISFRVYETVNKLGMLVLSLHMQKRDGLHPEELLLG